MNSLSLVSEALKKLGFDNLIRSDVLDALLAMQDVGYKIVVLEPYEEDKYV